MRTISAIFFVRDGQLTTFVIESAETSDCALPSGQKHYYLLMELRGEN
jgi:hypothetical protein